VNNEGYTLVELLVALVLTVMVLGGIFQLYISQSKSYNVQNQVAEMQQNVRIAMDVIARSIRSAGYDPRDQGFFGFTNTTYRLTNDAALIINEQANGQDTLFITMNANGDTALDDLDAEKVGYQISATGNLQIQVEHPTEAWRDLAENITTLTITYTFDDGNTYTPDMTNGPTVDDISNIRMVKVTIMGKTSKRDHTWPQDDGAGVGWRTRTLSSTIRPRNY
jgi:type IV pilus assembly protein PilW